MRPALSMIIRCNTEAGTIAANIRSLRDQTVPVEVITVDSGSTDDTPEIARRLADVALEIPPEDFSYGRSLNIGAARATAEFHGTMSAHRRAPSRTWAADSLRYYADERVAGTSGRAPHGAVPRGSVFPTPEEVLAGLDWEFSNTASTWRASVHRLHPFREDLPACEDMDFFWWGMRNGWLFAIDPALSVGYEHRRQGGLVSQWRRHAQEAQGLAMLDRPPYHDLREAAVAWWSRFPYESRWPRSIRRFSPYRVAEIGGSYAGARAVRRSGSARP